MKIGSGMRQREEASRRDRLPESADNLARSLLIGYEMDNRDHGHRGRLPEVDQLPDLGVGEDARRIAQVGQHDAGAALTSEQGIGMHMDNRIIVHIRHPHSRIDLMGDLMHIPGGRNTGPDINNLPDTGLTNQETHHPPEERAVLPGDFPRFGR